MNVQSLTEYKNLLLGNSHAFVFYFKNDCDEMINKFDELSKSYQNYKFFKVNLNNLEIPDLKVSPTIKYFNDGKEKDNYSGKSVDKLNLFVIKHFVQKVDTHETFTDYLKNFNGLIVVDFTATWCGPCKSITPFYHELNEKFSNVLFLKVDVDDNEETTAHCEINSMPTFQFYKNEEKIGQFSGADKNKLESMITTNN